MARSSLIPGFRFHPTDVELVMFYLKRKLLRRKIGFNAVAEVNIYDYNPWDLPHKSCLKNGDLEWYFFCPKARKYSSGGRFNRATETGFWKATGKDRKVEYNGRTVASIKTLIFHLGHARKGERTDWVMHEYRMEDAQLANAGVDQDMYVLCRIFQKSGSGPKNGAQYGAPFNEEEWDDDLASCSGSQAIVGPVGASNATGHKEKGPATTSMTEPGSSIFTFTTNEPANTPNDKQKGLVGAPDTTDYNQKSPAATNMTEPGSSTVTFTTIKPANTPDYKQKGPVADFNATGYKQKGLAATNMTEPGSSTVTASAARMNTNQVAKSGFCNDDDMLRIEDRDLIMGGAANVENVEIMPSNEDDYLSWMDFVEDWSTDVTLDDLLGPEPDDFDLGNFYVD